MAHISQLTQVHSLGKTFSIALELSRGTNPDTNSVAMGPPHPQAAVVQLMHLPVLKVSLKILHQWSGQEGCPLIHQVMNLGLLSQGSG